MSYRTRGDALGSSVARGVVTKVLGAVPVIGPVLGALAGLLPEGAFGSPNDAQIAAWNQFMAAELQRTRLQTRGTQFRNYLRARRAMRRRRR